MDLAMGVAGLHDLFEHCEQIWLPFIVLGELRAGFAIGSRSRHNERELARFLRRPGVEVAYATASTTRFYASVYAQLRAQATPIPTSDMWIAALVLEHGLALCTRDAHFKHLPQLELV
jgi:tRNA(fMet)-specific endonuclease VapC